MPYKGFSYKARRKNRPVLTAAQVREAEKNPRSVKPVKGPRQKTRLDIERQLRDYDRLCGPVTVRKMDEP